jgi:ABC-2 type transport system ATP-binding protein
VIQLSRVSAHAAPFSVSRVSLDLGPGVHALLGAPADGVAVLLAVMAGWIRPRAGTVKVLGRSPAVVRREVAYIPLEARLPPFLRVTEALDLAAAIRGQPRNPSRSRLVSLGIETLANRWTHTLCPSEVRAVLLAEAVTSTARVLLLDEPRIDMDPRASRALAPLLREFAGRGQVAVVCTNSPRDAADFSIAPWVFSLGSLVGGGVAKDSATAPYPAPVRMRVVANDTRRLLQALAAETLFARIELDGRALVLTGHDPKIMADAVAKASLAAGVELEVMRLEMRSLADFRAPPRALASEGGHSPSGAA